MSDWQPMTCSVCGTTKQDAIVEYGSYILRCAKCGDGVLATSFIAVQDSNWEVSAYRDPGPGQIPTQEQLLCEGKLPEIAGQVAKIANQGQAVLLVGKV